MSNLLTRVGRFLLHPFGEDPHPRTAEEREREIEMLAEMSLSSDADHSLKHTSEVSPIYLTDDSPKHDPNDAIDFLSLTRCR